MSGRPVTLIVLCWNRWELTRRCLETLELSTDLTGGDVDVLAVDNGSTDGTSGAIAKSFPWVRLLRLESNAGFVRGNNAGIAAAPAGNDIVLLNNDVEIHQRGWLDLLRQTAHSAADVGVVGCRLVLPDHRLLHAGTYILPDTCWGQQIGSRETDVNQYAHVREVQGIVFACAYIKREALNAVGLLSEDYETYFEDTDYCLRAKAAGFRTLCCGGVTLLHREHGSTSDSPGLFVKMFEKSRRIFTNKWKSQLVSRYWANVGWQSIMNVTSGYAASCRELCKGLDAQGLRLSYSYVYGPQTPVPRPEPPDSGDYLLNVLASRASSWRPPVSVVYAQGDVFSRNRGRYRIGYTMLEVDGFPKEWVRQANEMDEIWVPTRFNRQGFEQSGLKRPIRVMPLGVDTDHFHPDIKSYPNPNGDFVFLSSFEWGERKHPELLLSVFNRTFKRSDSALLLCKVINRDGAVSVRLALQDLGLSNRGGRIAFIYNKDFPFHELGMLYRSADCYVAAGRGEGWDMPLMEAMACGLPSIATDWGGHTEFSTSEIGYPLRVRGTIPALARCPYYDGFAWADPDPDHLSTLLRHVFENRDEAAAKGRRAAAEMANRWTWRAAAQRIAGRLREVAS